MSGFNNLANRTGLFRRSVESGQLRDEAQVCRNGHLINWSFTEKPEDNQKYCKKCGEETVTICSECNGPIPGKPLRSGVVMISHNPPLYCIHCGKPYPWTAKKIIAAKGYVRELDKLSDEEKENLSNGIEDLVRQTPRSSVVILQFKKVATKIGEEGWSMLKKILFEFLSKEIKEKFGMTQV